MFKLFGVKDENDDFEMDEDTKLEKGDDIFDEADVGQVVMDVLETRDDIVIVAPIAGISLEEIDISLEKTILTIKGIRKQPEIYKMQELEIKNSECYFGKFVRNIILPENLAFNKIKAIMENNMLIITIPKLRFNTKSIKIDRVES